MPGRESSSTSSQLTAIRPYTTVPNEFRPERFLGSRPQTYAWVPFGGGVKRCLGASFSMRELITVLHVMLREGEFTAVDQSPEKIVRRSIMLAPRHGTRVHYRPTG